MSSRTRHPKTRELNDRLGTPDQNAPLYSAARAQALKFWRGMASPLLVIEAIEAAATLPFDEGCQRERAIVATCLESDECRALIHAFFAERAVRKIPDLSSDTRGIKVSQAAVVGAGTMGSGIAMALANAGIRVRLNDATEDRIEQGVSRIRKAYESMVARGRLTRSDMDDRIRAIRPQLGYEGFEDVELVVEAVFEDIQLKKEILAKLDTILSDGTVLASNTSTLDIDELAGATSRPQNVVGLHFFNPAQVMRLLEIVRGPRTGPVALATVLDLAKRLRKVGVLVGNCRGFVGNRIMLPYMREAQFLVEEGSTPAEVDQALYDFGMAMGIFAVDDMGGLDLQWRVRQEEQRLGMAGDRPLRVLPRLCEMGRLGQKTGAGWYRYEDGQRTPLTDPEVHTIIEDAAREAGIERRSIDALEIVERCIYVMINEGARILEEGHALRSSDIDVIYLTGYGFPRWRGGPMFYADTIGLQKVLARIETFRASHGSAWEPAPLLRRLVAEGRTFNDLDRVLQGNAVTE